jgi:uncharacterized protein (TIGR02646 family)
MIFIDVSKINIPKEWIEEEARLTEELKNLPECQRSDFIDKHDVIWGRVKAELERISHNKCWYCEIINTRSNNHIDHHRPKNRVINENGEIEEGYWWLSFNHTNFRLACNYCNCSHTGEDRKTRGKSVQFPLLPGSPRCHSPDSVLEDEMPFLLDPTVAIDPPLLWFQDDGRACPKYTEDVGFTHHRAKKTIEILNLNDHKIVQERMRLRIQCYELISDGDEAFKQYNNGSPTGREKFRHIIQRIRELTNEASELSASANAFFRSSGKNWVRIILS